MLSVIRNQPAFGRTLARSLASSPFLLRSPTAVRWTDLADGSLKRPTDEQAKREMRDMNRIDELLRTIGQGSSDRQGIPMRDKTPWLANHTREPWSFTFDPSASSAHAVEGEDSARVELASEGGEGGRASESEGVLASRDESLVEKRMSDSYVEMELPLLSSPKLLSQYISTSGGLRIGKLMEHLDSLAGAISYKHALPAHTTDFQKAADKAGIYLATASADRLDLFQPLTVQDLLLSGQVVFAGNSSMECFLKMEGLREGGRRETLMLGRFTMVARDSRTHKARKINPLVVETQTEKDLFDIGREHKKRKQDFSRTSLSRQPPTTEEIANLHAFMLAHKTPSTSSPAQPPPSPKPDVEVVLTRETVTRETALMHPQERNLHGKVFGGYLMRLAYELSYSNTVLFARSPMRFLALDEISFALPVPIGSVLRLTATVTKSSTETNQVHSQVEAEVVNVSTGKREKTNDFHFTWLKDDGLPLTREVVPETYHEAMAWLEAQRRLTNGDQMRGLVVKP